MLDFLRTGLLFLFLLGGLEAFSQSAAYATAPVADSPAHINPKRIQVYYDSDQKLLKEVFYVRDTLSMKLEGPYLAYYANGSLKEKGQYAHNIATGFWQYYYESGNLKMEGELKEGSNWGHWKYYFENGNLSMEGAIYDGKRQDEWIHYYEEGGIKRRGKYLDNKKVGIWNYFYESQDGQYGPLKAQAFYENGVGAYKEFYPDSGLKSEGIYVDGKSEGIWSFYHPNGNIQAKGAYQDGVRVGRWEFYHEDGTLAAAGMYEDGLRQGSWEFYNPNGTISSQGEMKEGKKEGYWKLYDQLGEFRGEGNFVKGEGEYKEFYENGRIKTIGRISNDLNQGEWLYYYENGRLEGKANFVDGRGYYRGYYPDGTLNMEGEVLNGQRIGIWKMYKPNGELSGFYKVYYENDKPVYKIVDEKPVARREQTALPEYRYRVKSFRNFKPQINEFKGLILAANPLAVSVGSFPISAEYYIQERLGYDLQVTLIHKPFFDRHKYLEAGKEYSKGYSIALRQKFYQPEDNLGMFYFGHEIRVSPVRHFMNLPANGGASSSDRLQLDALKMEYSVLFGNRLTRDASTKGWTIDLFVGLGFGYQFVNERFDADNASYKNYFDDAHESRITIPVRVGANFGYAISRLKR